MTIDYQAMRTFADSWGLLYMFLIFLIAVLWTFRPGTKKLSDEAAQIPFNETPPTRSSKTPSTRIEQ